MDHVFLVLKTIFKSVCLCFEAKVAVLAGEGSYVGMGSYVLLQHRGLLTSEKLINVKV